MDTEYITTTVATAVTSPEMIALGYLARYPERTRKGYQIHLRQWFGWCSNNNINVLEAQRLHIEIFARDLSENLELKPQTVATKLNSICGLYRFAYLDGHLPVDPGAYVRRPKIPFQSSTEGLTRPEFADLLAAAEKESPTTNALVCLLGLNGLRIGECLATDIEDLGQQRGYRTIHLPERKGGKVGTLSLAVRTSWAIEQAIDKRNSGPILLGLDGKRLSAGSSRRTLKRLTRKCGINKRIHPHSLRHTFITMALDAGVSERDIIDSTGHEDSRMLRYYDRNRGAIERNATHAVAAFVGAAG